MKKNAQLWDFHCNSTSLFNWLRKWAINFLLNLIHWVVNIMQQSFGFGNHTTMPAESWDFFGTSRQQSMHIAHHTSQLSAYPIKTISISTSDKTVQDLNEGKHHRRGRIKTCDIRSYKLCISPKRLYWSNTESTCVHAKNLECLCACLHKRTFAFVYLCGQKKENGNNLFTRPFRFPK